MHKILVTGGAGYIGSLLIPELLKKGCGVTVVDNFAYGQTPLAECCSDLNFTVVRGDARDEALMLRMLPGVDFILPLACMTGAPACDRDPGMAESINLGAVKLLLKLRKKGQKIIFPTTNSGYGIGKKDLACDEKTPLNPISRYGRTKVEAEKEVLAAKESLTFRFATVFGMSPRMRLDLLVNDFVYRAVTDGFIVLFEEHFIRNYLHVRDAVAAFLHGIENFEKMKNESYNVGLSDCNISKRELCERIKKQVPRFEIQSTRAGKDPDQRNYIVSNQKIEATGFKPKYSLDNGIRELIKGYQIVRRNQFSNV